MSAPQGQLIIISGPSGSGKTTIVQRLLALEPAIVKSVSATTRPPRPGEVNGRSYIFLSNESFARRRQAGDFLECAEVYPGCWYGTLREQVTPSLAAGRSVLLEIDVRGMEQAIAHYPGAVTIFIQPPSLADLEQRLRARHTETEEAVQRRLQTARNELAQAGRYRFQVINDTVEDAVRRIRQILAQSQEKV
jgi:guanylate kinase